MFDISVARRLLMAGTIEWRGHVLTLSSCETEAPENVPSCSLMCGQAAVSPTVVIKQDDLLDCQNAVCSSASSDSFNEILHEWWRPADYGEQSKQIPGGDGLQSDQSCVDADFAHSSADACCPKGLANSSCFSSQSSETGSVTDLTVEPGEEVEDDDTYEKLEKSSVESLHEQLDHFANITAAEEYQCRRIPFPDEKLRLIDKLIASRCLEFRAEVRVKLDKQLVKISGAVADVEHTETEIRKLVVSFLTAGARISETGAKLLSTNLGKDWLNARLANEQLVAVFYVTDTMPTIMTDCQDGLTKVRHIIESSLMTRYRQFDAHHTKLLLSAVWTECIENLQSTHLLRISVDPGEEMRLVIEGCADDVEIALDKISKMLGENSRISHALKLKLGVYRVLCFRSCDVQHDARYVAVCVCF